MFNGINHKIVDTNRLTPILVNRSAMTKPLKNCTLMYVKFVALYAVMFLIKWGKSCLACFKFSPKMHVM